MTSNVELVFQESMIIEEESIYAHLLEEKTQDRIVIKVMIELIYCDQWIYVSANKVTPNQLYLCVHDVK